MANPKFIGPTYPLASRPASVQRTVNMLPYPLEPGNERSGWAFLDNPGLEAWSLDPNDVPDPLFADVILFLSARAATAYLDSAPTPHTIGQAGTAPTFNATHTLFGYNSYNLTDTTTRVTLSPDDFMGAAFGTAEWTWEAWVYPGTAGASGQWFATSGINGLWSAGTTFGFNCPAIGGSSYSVGNAVLTAGQFNHLVCQRNNTEDATFGFLEVGLNGTRVATSSTFLKSAAILPGSGFGWALGYGTIGGTMSCIDLRVTKNSRRYDMTGGTYTVPTDAFPIF